MTYAHMFDPHAKSQNVGPNLRSNLFSTQMYVPATYKMERILF